MQVMNRTMPGEDNYHKVILNSTVQSYNLGTRIWETFHSFLEFTLWLSSYAYTVLFTAIIGKQVQFQHMFQQAKLYPGYMSWEHLSASNGNDLSLREPFPIFHLGAGGLSEGDQYPQRKRWIWMHAAHSQCFKLSCISDCFQLTLLKMGFNLLKEAS